LNGVSHGIDRQVLANLRRRPKCGVPALAKMLTTLMVAARFPSGGALPFDLMLAYRQPANRIPVDVEPGTMITIAG